MSTSNSISFTLNENVSEDSVQFTLRNNNNIANSKLFLEKCFDIFSRQVNNCLQNRLKIEVVLYCTGSFLTNSNESQEKISHNITINGNGSILKGNDLRNWFKTNVEEVIFDEISEVEKKNDWVLEEITELVFDINTKEKIVFLMKKSAFSKRLQTFALKNTDFICPKQFLRECCLYFKIQVKKKLETQFRIKINCCFEAIYIKEQIDYADKNTLYVQTNNHPVFRNTDLEEWFKKNVEEVVLLKIEEFQNNGSGWTLNEIIELSVNINDFEFFTGSTYIPTPKFVLDKHCVINVQNKDNECFKWAILSCLYPAPSNADRVEKYKDYVNNVNFEGMVFPVDLKQISKFEQLNSSISVNVYMVEKKFDFERKVMIEKVLPVRLTQAVKDKHIHLLLLRENVEKRTNPFKNTMTKYLEAIMGQEEDTDTVEDVVEQAENEMSEETGHYCWIKNFSKLISSSCTKRGHKIFICDRCLCHFNVKTTLDEHVSDCSNMNECKLRIPDERNKWLYFTNYQRQLEIPFIVYADTESMLVPVENNDSDDDDIKIPKGAYQQHIPYSIGYYLHCRFDPSKSFYKSNTGQNCIEWFANELFRISTETIAPVLSSYKKMIISEEEEASFQLTTICSICKKTIFKNQKKVHDHCHITGKFRGAAHSNCNLSYQESRHIPVVFHNLKYDLHFLIEAVSNQFKGRVDIIPSNKENYISFTKCISDSSPFDKTAIKLKFIDSFQFMPSSLDKLASYLPEEFFYITKNVHTSYSDEQIHILTRKGVFPYDYIDSWEKLNVNQLPPKDSFYNKLNDMEITDEDYEFVQSVWTTFNINSMLEYAELYMKTDILLLADVFEKFRNTCLNLYELDPAQYYTLPGLSWDAMLKYTRVNIELLSDVDKILFVEKSESTYCIHNVLFF